MSRASLFVYGTLVFPQVMEAVTGRRFLARPARLAGFARYALRDEPFPGLVRQDGAVTTGVLAGGVDAATLAALDAFEGELYERSAVRTTDGAEAFTYVVAPAHRGRLVRTPWSRDLFERDHLDAWLLRCRAFRAAWLEAAASERRAGR